LLLAVVAEAVMKQTPDLILLPGIKARGTKLSGNNLFNLKEIIMKNKILTQVTLGIATSLLVVGTLNAAVPHTFAKGNKAVAAEVNENFDNLDQRLVVLEGSSPSHTVAVDCSADSMALKNMSLTPNTTYVLTGMCDGQIVVGAGLGTIRIEGDATGVKDDGIILPAGETDENTVFATIYGTDSVRLNLENLTISAANYNGANDLYISAIGSSRGAHVTLTQVDVVGGDKGIGADNTGTVSIFEGVHITGFSIHGINSAHASVVRVFNTVEIVGDSNSDWDSSEAVVAHQGGIIGFSDDGDPLTMHRIKPASGPNISIANDNTAAVSAFQNGTIRIVDADITGVLWSGESSTVDIRDSVQGEGYINPYRNSVMRIRNSQVANGDSGTLYSGDFSVLRMDNTTVGNTSGTGQISTYRFGVIDLRGTTDLNNRDINCSDGRETRIDGSVVNVGAVSC